MLKNDAELRTYYIQQQNLDALLQNESERNLQFVKPFKKKKSSRKVVTLVLQIAAFITVSLLLTVFLKTEPVESLTQISIDEYGRDIKVFRGDQLLDLTTLGEIKSGDKIITGNFSASFRYLNEETSIILNGNSEAVFRENGGAKVIYLNSGDLICDVDTQPFQKPMKIYTPHAEATVVGTQFLLTTGKDNSRLSVGKGTVNFRSKISNEVFEVTAGWTSRISKQKGTQNFRFTQDKTLIEVTDFTLINADTNLPFPQYDPIPEGSKIKLSELGTDRINILANVELNPRYVGSVRFKMNAVSPTGQKLKIYDSRGKPRNNCVESLFPFMFGGDTDDEPVKARVWKAVPGTYELKATPYGEKVENGISGKSVHLNFQILK